MLVVLVSSGAGHGRVACEGCPGGPPRPFVSWGLLMGGSSISWHRVSGAFASTGFSFVGGLWKVARRVGGVWHVVGS